MKRTLSIVCHPNEFTGHGIHACQVIRRLPILLGLDLVVRPTARGHFPADIAKLIRPGENDAEWEIILGPPNIQPTARKRTIYMTTCESTRLSAPSIQMINAAEIVVTPSQWCATVFNACGVNRPIVVVPLGVDNQFTYQPMPTGEPFTFACAGQLSNGANRKGIQRIIDLFLKAFPREDVRLNVKVMPNDVVYARDDNRIAVPRMFLNNEEVAHWLSRCNCFINLATEGFGLWPLQAMAIGRPVISPMYGGVTEYLRPELAVKHRLVLAQDSWHGMWAEADEESVIKQMRYAANPDNLEAVSWMGHKAFWSTKHLTWENSIAQLATVLNVVSPKVKETPKSKTLHIQTIQRTIQRTSTDPDYQRWIRGEDDTPDWKTQCKTNQWAHGEFEFNNQDSNIVRFNPGMCRFKDEMFLFPRVAKCSLEGNRFQNQIECWRLDSDMTPKDPRLIQLGKGEYEDARAFVLNNTLRLSVVRLLENKVPEIVFSELDPDFRRAIWVNSWLYGGNGDGIHWQKNWLPFEYENRLHFIYDANTVITDREWETCGYDAFRNGAEWNHWKWGQPRGGTPPIRIGDEFVTFFHSSIPWMPRHHRNRYFTGVYSFEAKPPFHITRYSREPVLIGCPNKADRLQPHAVIFVSGAVLDGDDYILSAGVNDDLSVWFRIPKTEIEERLKPV